MDGGTRGTPPTPRPRASTGSRRQCVGGGCSASDYWRVSAGDTVVLPCGVRAETITIITSTVSFLLLPTGSGEG